MKKITLLFTLLFAISIAFGQTNLIVNGDFESGGVPVSPTPSWSGFKNRVITDDLTSSLSGQVENGDGSLFQAFAVTPGNIYNVSFSYRWVTSAAANSTMVVRAKDNDVPATNLDITGGDLSNGFTLNTTVDEWFSAAFSITVPTGVTSVRLLFFKANGNKPLNLDNVSVTLDATASVADLQKFNFKSYPNPASDFIKVSAAKNIDKVEIYNLIGKQVFNETLSSKSKEINVSSLSDGVYIVKAYIENAVGTYKFIKKQN